VDPGQRDAPERGRRQALMRSSDGPVARAGETDPVRTSERSVESAARARGPAVAGGSQQAHALRVAQLLARGVSRTSVPSGRSR